ncbi:Mss4 protein [Cooperia oncophora]
MDFQLKAVPEEIILKKVTGRREPVNRDNLLNVDNKNWQSIVCRRCDSLILFEDKVDLVEGGYTAKLPIMTPGAKNTTDTEDISWWWHSTDDFDFDTIGYAMPMVDNKKILVCGDCEFGPIGLRNPDEKEFWLAVERVAYADKPAPKGHKIVPRKPKKAPT